MSPAYAFRHALIREAAYEALSKGERADLHARFAGWVERTSGERLAEVEESRRLPLRAGASVPPRAR